MVDLVKCYSYNLYFDSFLLICTSFVVGLGALLVLFTYCLVWSIIKTLVNGACSTVAGKRHFESRETCTLSLTPTLTSRFFSFLTVT